MAQARRGRPPKDLETRTQEVIQKMADKWPSAIVARTEVGTFTGGFISAKTMNNLDALGKGPREILTNENRVAYSVDELCRWLMEDYGLITKPAKEQVVPELLRK